VENTRVNKNLKSNSFLLRNCRRHSFRSSKDYSVVVVHVFWVNLVPPCNGELRAVWDNAFNNVSQVESLGDDRQCSAIKHDVMVRA
jgi:hypothetical protein